MLVWGDKKDKHKIRAHAENQLLQSKDRFQRKTSDFMLEHKVCKLAYIVKVSSEGLFLQRSDILVQEMKPFTFISYLIHMNVSGRNIFIASIQARILICLPKSSF